jgi:hypothetical protein
MSLNTFFLGSAFALFLVAGCGSSTQSQSGNPPQDGGGQNSADGTFLTVTGTPKGMQPVTATIQGTDYTAGNGVQCKEYVPLNTLPFLRIDAQGPGGGLASDALVQYFNFDSTQLERDEDFSPPAPQTTTFRLDATAWQGNNLFKYLSPSDWQANLADNPSCHTSFSRIDTTLAGTLVCTNVLSLDGTVLNDITVQFSCALMQ